MSDWLTVLIWIALHLPLAILIGWDAVNDARKINDGDRK